MLNFLQNIDNETEEGKMGDEEKQESKKRLDSVIEKMIKNPPDWFKINVICILNSIEMRSTILGKNITITDALFTVREDYPEAGELEYLKKVFIKAINLGVLHIDENDYVIICRDEFAKTDRIKLVEEI